MSTDSQDVMTFNHSDNSQKQLMKQVSNGNPVCFVKLYSTVIIQILQLATRLVFLC